MTPPVRTTVTLVTLLAGLLVTLTWGWSLLTSPFPGTVEAPSCVETAVHEGEDLTTEQVTVTVLNAGERAGLASRTMVKLLDQGFQRGSSGNVTDVKVSGAQIWTDDPDSPAVELLASRLRKPKIVQRDIAAFTGVVLVVGDKFTGIGKGPGSVTVREDTTVCSPPAL